MDHIELLSSQIINQGNQLTSLIQWSVGGLAAFISILSGIVISKINTLDEKLTDVDRRVCRIEGAIANKDCCMIKDESKMKKVE